MRWLALAALVLLATTVSGLLLSDGPSRLPSRSPATPLPVPVERLPDLLAGMPGPPAAETLRGGLSADLEELARTRAALEEERRILRALGRGMAGVLDPEQARWLAANRDDVSLNRFEKPYWRELEARLRR